MNPGDMTSKDILFAFFVPIFCAGRPDPALFESAIVPAVGRLTDTEADGGDPWSSGN
jgi:hypothetical protein